MLLTDLCCCVSAIHVTLINIDLMTIQQDAHQCYADHVKESVVKEQFFAQSEAESTDKC